MRLFKLEICVLVLSAALGFPYAYSQEQAPAVIAESPCVSNAGLYDAAVCQTFAARALDASLPVDAPSMGDAPARNRLLTVGAPKIYDDLYLRQQLASLQTQLQNTHAVDQATLLSHIGVAQGADLRQTSAAISASGPSTPSVSTFSLPPGVPAFSYPPGYTASSGDTAFPTGTATASTPGTTTAISSMTPAAPTPTAPTLVLPSISSLGQSSLDTYNESLQLSAEITNTSLLLQGALSDQISQNGHPKTTITIGFPITVGSPSIKDKDLAGAVAEVHVGICSYNNQGEPPSIATLLPQERTYNVASLVEKNFLGSASAITGGVVNVGGGILWSHKRYYLVQQQETVALLTQERRHACGNGQQRASFSWEIRPVLGKEFIRPGTSVNFVQFATPEGIETGTPTQLIGQACVSVVWRKPALTGLFRKKSDEYFSESDSTPEHCYNILYRNTMPDGDQVQSVTDIGQGFVTVQAYGTFLPGVTVRLGNVYLPPDNITATRNSLKFTASASALVAAGDVYFVGRDGREVPALHQIPPPKDGETPPAITMSSPSISPYSDSQSLLKIGYADPSQAPMSGDQSAGFVNPAVNPLVIVIGGKVFGLSDAPFFAKTDSEIQLVVPTTLIQSSPVIELRRLLWPDFAYRKSMPIPSDTFSKAMPAIASASILSSQNGLTIGLVGTGLDKLRMVFPSCLTCTAIPAGSTFLQVTLPKPPDAKSRPPKKKIQAQDDKAKKPAPAKDDQPVDPTDGLKQIAFCRKSGTLNDCDPTFPTLLVDVPKLDPAAPKPSLDKSDPLPLNTAQVKITGTMLDQIASIEYAKLSLPFRLIPGKKPSLVVDLPVAIRSAAGGYPLFVTFADKTTTAYLVTIKKKDS